MIDAAAPVSAPDDVAASTSTILGSSTPSICTVPGGCGTYTVAAGDNPTSVAEQFCITATELAAANSWSSFDEFPQPGANILVPPHADGDTCPTADG